MAPLPDIDPDTPVYRTANQVSGEIDGQVVLLSIENGAYFKLNEVGTRIWQLIETPHTITQLTKILQKEFAVSPEQCRAEVHRFLQRLKKRHLLQMAPQG